VLSFLELNHLPWLIPTLLHIIHIPPQFQPSLHFLLPPFLPLTSHAQPFQIYHHTQTPFQPPLNIRVFQHFLHILITPTHHKASLIHPTRLPQTVPHPHHQTNTYTTLFLPIHLTTNTTRTILSQQITQHHLQQTHIQPPLLQTQKFVTTTMSKFITLLNNLLQHFKSQKLVRLLCQNCLKF
jgi:hypothetical protein